MLGRSDGVCDGNEVGDSLGVVDGVMLGRSDGVSDGKEVGN